MFPHIGGRVCSFNETASLSGTLFTFDYFFPFLYVTDLGASSNSILYIFNVATTPTLVSTTSLPNGSGARNPLIVGDTLYIPYRTSSALALWNVADRTAPVLLGSCSITDPPFCVSVLGTFAATGSGGGFVHTADAYKVDVSNPASPTVVDSVLVHSPTTALVTAIHASDTHFFMSGQHSSGGPVYVAGVNAATFNVSDIAQDSSALAGILQDMVISSDFQYAYCTNRENALVDSWSIADPTNISLLQSTAVGGTGCSLLCLVDSTHRLYAGPTAGSTIRIMNVSNPASMTQAGNISTSGETVSDMANTDGCPGFVWGQGTGAAIHLIGTAPLS